MDKVEKYYRQLAKEEIEQGEATYVEFYNKRLEAIQASIDKVLEEAHSKTFSVEQRSVYLKRGTFSKKLCMSSWVLCDYNAKTINLLENGKLAWCDRYTGRATPISLKSISKREDESKRELTQENLARLCFVLIEANAFLLSGSLDIFKQWSDYLGSIPSPNGKGGHH